MFHDSFNDEFTEGCNFYLLSDKRKRLCQPSCCNIYESVLINNGMSHSIVIVIIRVLVCCS